MAAHMTTTIRKMLDDYINSVSDGNLETFVRTPMSQPGDPVQAIDFGSKDFQFVFTGRSTGEPAGLWMFEIRAKPTSENKALKALAQNSTKFQQNERRFALVMYPSAIIEFFAAQHVRMALKKSPVWEEGVINKVHVQYDKAITFFQVPGHSIQVPMLAQGMVPSQLFKYELVPFDGFDKDGTELKKSGKQEKKKDGGKK